MISVEQVKMLEERVHHVVQRMNALRQENGTLHEQLGVARARIEELEAHVAQFADSQAAIERGILSALQHLDTIEDEAVEAADGARIVESSEQEPAIYAQSPTSESPAAEAAAIESTDVESESDVVESETEAEEAGYAEDESLDESFADEEDEEAGEPDAEYGSENVRPASPELDIF